ncbi:T9SS type A sorting domain-containing protein [candidate division KSB1 bacterium]|nr:T9SS type A sorting domain-containing protein [candidate division KSB1 bacterium]
MKKLLLSVIILSLFGLPAFAQVEVDWEATGGVFFDFENDTSTWNTFPDYALQEFYIDANPDASGINPSDSVGVFLTADGSTWEGCHALNTRWMPIDFDTYPIIKVKVWAPDAGMIFMVKVENFDDNSISPIELQGTTTVGSDWEEMEYDFSAAAGNGVDYGRIVLFPDFTGSSVDEWFFDDVMLDGVPPVSAVDSEHKQASTFLMATNYPNPFNPQTTIEYTLPKQADVTLTIYDAIGNQISVLVNENQNAGNYTVPFNGSNVASGIYFYRLEAGHDVFTQKMVLMK